MKRIKNALISVFHKERLDEIVSLLRQFEIEIFSTGGTHDYIAGLGIPVYSVESLTSYPSILGGRVKTLHPKIFGGILGRRDLPDHMQQLREYGIPEIDLVIVDLYPFEETLAKKGTEQEIIEKIDIGGISLIRAAAKNFQDVLIVPAMDHYDEFIALLREKGGITDIDDRKRFAAYAFDVSSHYDTQIHQYLSAGKHESFKASYLVRKELRYGENPHQQAAFFGNLSEIFEQLHGREISYNNLGDLDAAIALINEFAETTFAILKHNNACGLASRPVLKDAWEAALAGDPVSAFGGVLICNIPVDIDTAKEINKLFFEIILAPAYDHKALDILREKKNRIILQSKPHNLPIRSFRSILNGVISQERDLKTERSEDLKPVSNRKPTNRENDDLIFAGKIVKHTRSNAIALAANKQLIASGIGQTSRVDALKQAISKAGEMGFDLRGAVMASDAFFPFADSVEIAHKAGITAVIQPGGSVRDQESIDYCNKNNIAMVFTGIRHFKH